MPVVAFDADVVGRSRGGDESVALGLLAALARLDLPYRILAYVRDRAALPPTITESGVVVPVAVPVGSNYARVASALPTRLAADRPALYHGNYVLPPRLPCPGVVTVHDCSFLRIPESMPRHDRLAFARFVPWSARRAARIVVVSEFTKHDLLDGVPGLDPERVVVVPNAAEAVFRPRPDGPRPVAEPYVVAIGALRPRKNLQRLVEAWAIVKQRLPGSHVLVLAGHGPSGDRLDDLAVRLGIADSVRRIGHLPGREAVAELVAGAAAVAFPSLYEGFGLPALEAMQSGTPVVCSNTTALPEVVGDAALLVDPLSPVAIAAGLERVLSDPAEAARLAAAGLDRAQAFSWDRSAALLARVYEELIPAVSPARTARSRIAVSVISTGEADRLGPCLDSVAAQTLAARVVVVANGDGSGEFVRERFPAAEVLERATVESFGRNHTDALELGDAEFGLILNPDVVLDRGCLEALIALMDERPSCGLVAPLLRYPDGSQQPSARRFPEPVGTLVRRTPLRAVLSTPDHYLPPPVAPRRIDWALGACLLVRMSAFRELGGFDERYRPLYVEDIDLAWRLWQAGYEVWQTPAAVATHEHQAVTDRSFLTRRTWWHTRNMARFVRRHPAVLRGSSPALADDQSSSR